MNKPFTASEVQKAIKSIKNNKSAGCDDVKAELLKHAPHQINECIAKLLNHMAKTGDYPEEIKKGILIPIPKPGKKQGPPQNLRPIVLLSILRKVLAIIMITRCQDKINSQIPITQAAYRSGRGTTEHVFTIKTLAEKAITSSNYEINILLLDMSKAFDTIKRDILMEDLKEILAEDELHIFYLLLKDVEIQVKIDKHYGETISTNIGAPQGDCASAILFTLYLAKALQDKKLLDPPETSQSAQQPSSNQHNLTIDQQYADDIGWATTNTGLTTNIKKNVPPILHERNLNINLDKTEEYIISKEGPENWKKCRYLGSLLSTEEDINRRKSLAIHTFNQLKHVFNSDKTSINIKMRIFQAYVCSVFLYNSELWTLTKKQEHKIDVFQRTLLRKVARITKLDRVRNEDLYGKTKGQPWSHTIKKRRLNWLGHLLRLPSNTPARQALSEYERKVKRPVGRPKPTWVAHIIKECKSVTANINLTELEIMSKDRRTWRQFVARVMAT